MTLLWTNHRLAWPFVVLIVLVTLSAVGFDYSWRVWVIPFRMLLVGALVIDAIAACALVAVALALRHR